MTIWSERRWFLAVKWKVKGLSSNLNSGLEMYSFWLIRSNRSTMRTQPTFAPSLPSGRQTMGPSERLYPTKTRHFRIHKSRKTKHAIPRVSTIKHTSEMNKLRQRTTSAPWKEVQFRRKKTLKSLREQNTRFRCLDKYGGIRILRAWRSLQFKRKRKGRQISRSSFRSTKTLTSILMTSKAKTKTQTSVTSST